MTEDIPDTAVAQTLATMRGIAPVALTCIGAGSAVLVISLLFFAEKGIGYAVLQTAISAVLSFAATRYFLSAGRAPVQTPLATLRDPAFLVFVQLELLLMAVLEIMERLSGAGGLLAVIGIAGYLCMIYFIAKYGTVFPAIVAGGDASLAAAAERGTTRALLWRLVAATALGFMMIASLILLPGIAMQRSFAVEAPLGLAIMAPLTIAISAFTSVLIAVVLSKAYQGRYRT